MDFFRFGQMDFDDAKFLNFEPNLTVAAAAQNSATTAAAAASSAPFTAPFDNATKTYCVCNMPYDPNSFMIECDSCKDWFHGRCVGVKEFRAIDLDRYHCPQCQNFCGPSIEKQILNNHRHDVWDANAATKPVQTGTEVFIHELQTRHFTAPDDAIVCLSGAQVTRETLCASGFERPILTHKSDDLNIVMPPDTIDVATIAAYIGDLEVDVVDVHRQSVFRMHVTDLVDYYKNPYRTRVFNCISLEFSHTPLAPFVEAPLAVRDLDWVEHVWPNDPTDELCSKRPAVQKFCLISAKGSFTDFHIDFGGSSVWYHVLRGVKVFYLIKPTQANVSLYERWMTSKTQSETFFADQVDKCYRLEMTKGQTLLIPTGWIHAVYTPCDSIVFGGNFLHSLNIPLQLQVNDIEKKNKVPEKYQFPSFETINWYAAKKLMLELKQINSDGRNCPETLLSGVKSLLHYLKQWNADKYLSMGNEAIPATINSHKLLKDLNKEIRLAERFLMVLNPPKPERESKRKKRKPINDDFIDYSNPNRGIEFANWTALSKNVQTQAKTPAKNVKTASKTNAVKVTTTSTTTTNSILHFTLVQGTPYSEIQNIQPITEAKGFNVANGLFEFTTAPITDITDEFVQKKPSKSELSTITHDLPNTSGAVPRQFGNGIESLLQASTVSRTAPSENCSTREAIAGMLSMGYKPTLKVAKKSKRRKVAKRKTRQREYVDSDALDDVHQDDEYIYPSLDMSDDDDQTYKPRGKSKDDESWSPKARVGPLLPKMNRPAREGTKRQAVEKVLEAAAFKRADETRKRGVIKKKPKKKIPIVIKKEKVVKREKKDEKEKVDKDKVEKNDKHEKDKVNKGRKGFKTAKQRLGKILKMHKMIR